jgi:hypothetical protein
MNPQILLRSVLLIALILPRHSSFAQPLARAERILCRQLQIIDSFSEALHGPTHNIDAYDSISRYDSLFGEMLQRFTAGNPASLYYPFTRLQNQGVTIATSPDGRLRIYSWDGQTGGTAHNANNMLQGHATLEILQLEGDSLRSDVALIRTASGTTGTLGFDYILDNDGDPDFHFNPATHTITFPVVLDDGHATKRKITYTFNGKYFVRTNN